MPASLLDGAVVETVAAAARAAPARAGATRVVALDGRSGAGKTTLAAALAERLAAPILALEPLYEGWDGLERGVELLVADVLAPLAAGRAAHVPVWDWHAGRPAAPWRLEPPPLLVVEGVGAGAPVAAPYLSLLVWLELADAERKARALDRDGDGYRPFWDAWAAQEDALLARDHPRDRADLVIDPSA